MAPTLITSYKVSTGDTSNLSTLTTPSFTPAAGELIVCKMGTNDVGSPAIGTLSSSAGSLVFTQRDNVNTSGKCPTRISTAPVTTSVAMTISCTYTGTAGRHFLVVERWQNAKLDTTPNLTSPKTGTGSAPSTTLTTEAADSVITWVNTDWDLISGSRTYRSSAVETQFEQPGGGYCWYTAYQAASTAGSKTLGMTSPSGQAWALVGIELQNSDATRTNLSPNPALKTNATGWSATGSGWARSTSVDAALPRTTGFEGTTATDILTPRAAVVAGQSYYWAVSVKAHATLAGNMLVNYYDHASAGNFIGNSGTTVPLNLTAGATSRFVLGPYTVPTGAISGYLRLNDLASGGAEITAYQVEKLATFGSYFDGDTAGASWTGTSGNSTSTLLQAGGGQSGSDPITIGETFTKTVTADGPLFSDTAGVADSISVVASSSIADTVTVADGFLIASLEWDEDKGRNRVSAFRFRDTVTTALVMRKRTQSGPWELVRGGTISVVNGVMLRPADDYEFPSGVDLDYRIQGLTAAGVVLQSATVRRTSMADAVWLKFITQPSLNRRLEYMGRSEITRQARTAAYDVQGRSDPVVVSDVHSSRRMTIRCKTETPAEAAVLDHALRQGLPCYLQVPETLNTPSMYAVVGDYQFEAPALRSQRSVFTIPLVEVAAPPPTIVSPGETWQNVVNTYATWEALMAAVATWMDIAD